jgi:nonstructural protein NSm
MKYDELVKVLTTTTCSSCDMYLDTDELAERAELSNQCYQCYSDKLSDTEYQKRFGSLQTYAWDPDDDSMI